MEDKTQQIVDEIEDAAQYFEETEPVQNVRELWNWQRNRTDADIEIRFGTNANLMAAIRVVKNSESWTIRFLDTMEPDIEGCMASMALVYHEPVPEPEGTMFTDDVLL